MGTVANLAVRISANAQDFEKGLGNIETRVSGLSGTFSKIGAGLVAAFSFDAITSQIDKIGDWGGKIVDFSNRLGISSDQIQRFKFAAEQGGSSIETIGRAMEVANRQMAGKDAGFAHTLKAMGLSVAELKHQAPDQMFIALARALQEVEDPALRDQYAMELFGRAGQEIQQFLPEFIENLHNAPVAMTGAAEAADMLGDAFDRLKTKGEAAVGGVVFGIVEALKRSDTGAVFQGIGQAAETAGNALSVFMAGGGFNVFGSADEKPLSRFGAQALEMTGALKAAEDRAKGLKDYGLDPLTMTTGAANRAWADMTKRLKESHQPISETEQAIRRLTEKIGGDKLISEANTWVEAIARIGGIGALTHKELKQFSTDIQEAVEKLRLMGQEVPITWEIIADTLTRDKALADTRKAIGESLKGFEMNRQDLLLLGGPMDQSTLAGLMQGVPQAVQDNITHAQQLENVWTRVADSVGSSFKRIGDDVTSNLAGLFFGIGFDKDGSLQRAADEATANYERIRVSGTATPQEIKAAWDKMREAEDAANYTFTERLVDLWKGVKESLIGIFNDILQAFTKQAIGGLFSALSGGSFSAGFGNLGGMLGGLFGGGGAAAGRGAAAAGAGAGTGAGGGGLGGLFTNPWTAVIGGAAALGLGIWKGGLFRGGEEALQVNPARDAFFRDFQDRFGGDQQAALATAFSERGIAGDVADRMIKRLYEADTMKEFEAATAAINKTLAEGIQQSTANNAQLGAVSTQATEAVSGLTAAISGLGQAASQIAAAVPAMGDQGTWNDPGYAGPEISDESMGIAATGRSYYRDADGNFHTVPYEDMSTGGSVINVNLSGTLIGNAQEFEDAVGTAFNNAVEGGGDHFTKFRKLTTQAVAAGA